MVKGCKKGKNDQNEQSFRLCPRNGYTVYGCIWYTLVRAVTVKFRILGHTQMQNKQTRLRGASGFECCLSIMVLRCLFLYSGNMWKYGR